MEPMQPPEPMKPPDPGLPTLPPRSTPLQPAPGFPGWGAVPVSPPAAPGWGGAQPPYGGPLPPTQRLHGLATAALVCGLIGLVMFWFFGIVPLLALIFGLVSTRTINSSGGRLRGLGQARAGWILGLIGVVGAAVFLWAVATDRIGDNSSPYQEAKVGDCVGELPAEDVVYELDFVSCDVAHSGEVYLIGDLNPNRTREYPGETTIFSEVEAACFGAFESYVGLPYEQSVFEVYYLYPRALSWKIEGGGGYYCFLVEVGAKNIGSAFHSDR